MVVEPRALSPQKTRPQHRAAVVGKHDIQHHSNLEESNRRAQKFENWFARRLALVALLSGVSSDLFSIGLIVGI
jgi:hypothetical protein